MSSSAISGLSGIVSGPLTLQAGAVQATAMVAPAAPASPFNATQPILMVPTKPPLSPAVMAELIGRQAAPYGSPLADNTGEQTRIEGTTATLTNQGNQILLSK